MEEANDITHAVEEAEASEQSTEEVIPDPTPDWDDKDATGGPRTCTRSLGLSRSYAPNWKREHAFREFYQNWKDAIIESFDLDLRDFRPEIKEMKSQIRIAVYRPDPSPVPASSRELLGYILFDRKAGSLELTNFKAKLTMSHLLLGHSTKRRVSDDRFAGQHGEGFKLAALVMTRESHKVRYATDSFYWHFSFGKSSGVLGCHLFAVNAEANEKRKAKFASGKAAGRKRGFRANSWEDVQVKISMGADGKRIAESDFREWLNVTIDINGPQPSQLVETSLGEILLDERFTKHIYLKGLLVSGPGASDRDYEYGYNFHLGKIDRDRGQIRNPRQEAHTLADMWEQAIRQRGQSLLGQYIKLFQKHPQCADISLATEFVSKATATDMWRHLRTSDPDAFFFCDKNGQTIQGLNNAEADIREMNKQPRNLEEALWHIFRKYSLIRTPGEEIFHRFTNSNVVSIDQNPFAFTVLRSLRACMHVDSRTKHIKFQVVSGGGTDMSLVFDKPRALILLHQKWIDFEKVHSSGVCDAFSVASADRSELEAFCQDHVVEDLFETALAYVNRSLLTRKLNSQQHLNLRRAARRMIQQMPRVVKLSQTTAPAELKVSWMTGDDGYMTKIQASRIHYFVMLHKERTCWERYSTLLLNPSTTTPDNDQEGQSSSNAEEGSQTCSCARQTVSQMASEAVFSGLDPAEKYFPMVSRTENGSLFGIPPSPLSPAANSSSTRARPMRASIPLESSYTRSRTPSPESRVVDTTRSAISELEEDLSLDHADISVRQTLRHNDNVTPSNTPRRRVRAQESSNSGQRNISLADQAVCDKDEKAWETWQEKDLPAIFVRLSPYHRMHHLNTSNDVFTVHCEHLNFTFERGEYAHVRFRSEGSKDYIVYIHEIRCKQPVHGIQSYFLLVRLYSFLRDTLLFQAGCLSLSGEIPINPRELVLHFSRSNAMGDWKTAEMVCLKDITFAAHLESGFGGASNSVIHTENVPDGTNERDIFCRFGILRKGGIPNLACLTPVPSHLVSHRERSKRQKLTFNGDQPLVFDMTATTLGPSEGFSQAGFMIHSGFGCEHDKSATWKMRHPTGQLFDGPALDALKDFEEGRLRLPLPLRSQQPRIALVTGESAPFRLSPMNKVMQTLDQFLKPLDVLDETVRSAIQPHFIVAILPSAVLHPSALKRLSGSIFKLLEQKFSVQLRLLSMRAHDIPQKGSRVAIIAAPPYSMALSSWNAPFLGIDSPQLLNIGSIISDISFKNSRASWGTEIGSVCCNPEPSSGEEDTDRPRSKLFYNHQTDRIPNPGGVSLNMSATSIWLSPHSAKSLVHPIRGDPLTVREIARLQGFGDDFVFYNSEEYQFASVLRALPPKLAHVVATAIRSAILSLTEVRLGNSRHSSTAAKRPRVEEENHDDLYTND